MKLFQMTKQPHQDFKAFQEGDVLGFSRKCRWWNPAHWISKRIQTTTDSPYNHVALLAWDAKAGEWTVIEALLWGGVRQNPLRRYLITGFELVAGTRQIDFAGRIRIVSWAKRKIGTKYDWRKILKIRLAQIALGHNVVDRIQEQDMDDALICSEAVLRAYRQAGYLIPGVGDYGGPGATMAAFQEYRKWNGREWEWIEKEKAA
jgi:hypothetical protein